jgi:hypothetical protein
MTSDQKLSVGVVVLCAKSDELTHILAVFNSEPQFKRLQKPKNSAFVEYVIEFIDGRKERVLIGCCRDMGSVYAAAQTGFIIGTAKPNVVIFVGTAATLNEDKCKVGDVVIPKNCEARFYNKVSGKTTNEYRKKRKLKNFREYFFSNGSYIASNGKNKKDPFETVLTWERRQAQLTPPAEMMYASFMAHADAMKTKLQNSSTQTTNPSTQTTRSCGQTGFPNHLMSDSTLLFGDSSDASWIDERCGMGVLFAVSD